MAFQQYLNTHPVAKLQIGCGGNMLAGWLNTDGQMEEWFHPQSVKLDATQPFPIPDNSFDYIFTEHMIEHIGYWEGYRMLEECYRILKPGGKIRISCPSIELLQQLCADPDHPDHAAYIKFLLDPKDEPFVDPMFIFNKMFRFCGHKHIYTMSGLTATMAAVGFDNFTEHNVMESDDPVFQKLEKVWHMPDYDGTTSKILQLETMTVEAIK
jgi:SAM-dependent methyltransferase